MNEEAAESRYTTCEECGNQLDKHTSGVWKSPNDEQWWHEGCYDKTEKAEQLAEQIRTLITPEDEFDGLSDHFHRKLDSAHGFLEDAVETERLMQDQGIGHYDADEEGGQ